MRADRGAVVLTATAALLLLAWSLVVPVFEAPDEPAHWQYARYLHDHWTLPRYAPGFEEANSPPLYYLVVAPFAGESPLPSMLLARDEQGGLASLEPPRFFLNSDRDFWPYLPVRLGRLVSVLMATAAVWLTYRAGLAVTSDPRTGLLAGILIAFLPQFTFRGGNVSNDAAVTMFAAGTTLLMVRMLANGFTWRRGLIASTLLALAYLSKISAIALTAPLSLALLLARPQTSLAARGARLSALGLALLIVLPWSIRNVLLYGDPFASGAMRTAVSHIITDRSLFSSYFVTFFPVRLAVSTVGAFGWMNVTLPKWIYAAYAVLALSALVGLVLAWRHQKIDRRVAACLALTGLASLAVVVHINLSFTQPQGRYLFPSLPAMGVLGALGVQALPRSLQGLGRPLVLGVALLAINLYALVGVVHAGYYPPVARDVGSGARLLQAAAVNDLAYDPTRNLFVVTGADPNWLMPADVDASAHGSVEVELQASASPTEQKSCVYFATDTRGLAETQPQCFSWQADGRLQRHAVNMRSNPDWNGRVTHLRIDPIEHEAERHKGTRVALRTIRLLSDPR